MEYYNAGHDVIYNATDSSGLLFLIQKFRLTIYSQTKFLTIYSQTNYFHIYQYIILVYENFDLLHFIEVALYIITVIHHFNSMKI